MKSLFDELTEKLDRDPRLTKRGGPRVDLSLFLFNHRDAIRDLWAAADRSIRAAPSAPDDMRTAVERLRPLFGERQGR